MTLQRTIIRSDQVRQPLVNTTAYWEEHAAYVPKKDQEIIYSDGGTITQGGQTIPVPKYKVGDGVTTVGNLPFTDSDTRQGMAGTLNTTNTTAQTPVASESLSGNVNLHKVSKTGSYDDLNNKPTIPTVNDATLTIQKNSTTIDTFTANADTNRTIDISVPVVLDDLDDVEIKNIAGGDILIYMAGKTSAFVNRPLNAVALPASTKYAASISLSIDSSTYVVTAQLKDQDGNNIGAAQTIDLPLESVVVSGSYNAQTKKVVLTLQNGSTIEFSVADLVAGLQSEITAQNPLSADLVVDGNVNKVFTLTMKTKLDGIEAGAEVNVQSDWNQTDNTQDDYIKNKPTIPTLRTMNHEQLTDSTLGDINIHDGFYFPNAVQDYDGNWYGAVVIGDQVWLGENLRTTHYSDGTSITIDNSVSSSSKKGTYPNGSSQNKNTYGLLYNLTAVLNGASASNSNPSGVQGISPTGWHVPSVAEFGQLVNYVKKQKRFSSDGDVNTNNIAKSFASNNLWAQSDVEFSIGNDLDLNNKLFFNAVPSGYFNGSYYGFNSMTFFKTTTKKQYVNPSCYELQYNSSSFQEKYHINDWYGSVRCVSDLSPIQFRNWYIEQYGSLQHHLPQEIPSQVNSDWNATSGVAEILNKPTLTTVTFRHW